MNMSHHAPLATGQCLCGSVCFSVSAVPRFVANCHCSLCRRAHGAEFVTWAGVQEDGFQITMDHGTLKDFQSSPEAIRQFCSKCGSPMFFRSRKWPGEIHVALALIAEPHSLKPNADVFWDDRACWHDPHGIRQILGGDSGTEPKGYP